MTTIDVATTFSKVKRGYDPAEVDQHLTQVERDFHADLSALRKDNSTLEALLAEAKEREEAVHLTIIAAAKAKEELLAQAEKEVADATTRANAEADKILKEAKFEAFRLVTGARDDADGVVSKAKDRAGATVPDAESEAKRIIASARNEAERLMAEAERQTVDMIAVARSEAMEVVTTTQIDAQRADEEANLQLPKLHEELAREVERLEDRIADLRRVAVELEADVQDRRHTEDVQPPATSAKNRINGLSEAIEAADTMDVAASAGGELDDDVDELVEDGEVPLSEKGSFYSRRSAKLPRIGDGAGRDALAAMNGLRGRMSAQDTDHDDSPRQSDDLSVQTG